MPPPNDWSRRDPDVPPLPRTPALFETLDQVTDAVIEQVADRLLARYTTNAGGQPILLTAQELRIATMMGNGVPLKEIAETLGLTCQNDIHNRVRRCCRKHGITRHQLAVFGAFLNLRKENR